jgi:predicted nucleic acid-binding Zn ribbon protein
MIYQNGTGGEAMPFCPDCGTQASEDTQFCPECGRPLAVGRVVKGRSKKKIAGIIVACLIAIIVTVVIATQPPTSIEPEPAIPAHFATYTDELGLFSVSYPPEWELDLGVIEEKEQAIRDIISSIDSDLPVEGASVLFLAGVPSEMGLFPSVTVGVEPCPVIVCTHDAVIKAEIEGAKVIMPD